MHHKRGRPHNRRAGCKLCKPWKVNGFRTERIDGETFGDHRRRRRRNAIFETPIVEARQERAAVSNREHR